tara:strand:- start:3008 stop:3475 length:468 start_codon:yes stop_codon:yes gene_type:complete
MTQKTARTRHVEKAVARSIIALHKLHEVHPTDLADMFGCTVAHIYAMLRGEPASKVYEVAGNMMLNSKEHLRQIASLSRTLRDSEAKRDTLFERLEVSDTAHVTLRGEIERLRSQGSTERTYVMTVTGKGAKHIATAIAKAGGDVTVEPLPLGGN